METERINVSVILPCYNGEKTLVRAIESFLNQSLSNCQLILADDCSQDGTRDIVADYAKRYPEMIIPIYMEANTHGSGVIKAGILCATGRYICIFDQDDWMDPLMLESLYIAATGNGIEYDMADCDICVVDSRGNVVETRISNGDGQVGVVDDDKRAGLFVKPGYCLTKIIRRKFLVDNNIWHFDCCSYEDNYFMILCSAHVKSIAKVREALYYKMQRDGSVTRSINNPITYDRIESALCIETELKKRGFFDKFKEEISFRFVELYYINSIVAFLCNFQPSDLDTLKMIRKYIQKNYPTYRNNKYFGNHVTRKKKILSLLNDYSPELLVFIYAIYRRIRIIIKDQIN